VRSRVQGDAWVQFKPQYYLYAIIFLIFDVETIFLLPFAAAFPGLPLGAFIAMVVFLILLPRASFGPGKRACLPGDNMIDPQLRAELSRQGVFTTTLDELYNWGRKNSVWPLGFGLACCAIEMIATSMARWDLARFGAEVFRPSPRQADLMIVAGTVTKKMAPQVVRLYNQMPEPKYVIAMGACAISGGPFKEGYNVLKGIDRYIPVDIHIPGCPPRPEALLEGFMALQRKIEGQSLSDTRATANGSSDHGSECLVPTHGEHDLEPPKNPDVWHPPKPRDT
jgi:NADH-quinone oxidoreductase subunit B